jgi:hypothetical protein
MPERETALSRELFDQVVDASGLSTIIARAAVSRACARAGVSAFTLTRESLMTVIPHLEVTLRIYIGELEAVARIQAIQVLARRRSSIPPSR